jgi:hypothetical protein
VLTSNVLIARRYQEDNRRSGEVVAACTAPDSK